MLRFLKYGEFFGSTNVKTTLGVGDIDFVSCSSTAYEAFSTDTMRNLEIGIPVLLEDGMKVLIYAEEYDVICNWLGIFQSSPFFNSFNNSIQSSSI